MKISVILGHPYENSFNAAIAKTVITQLKENNHEVFFHDLYKEEFNPIISSKELVSDIPEDALLKTHQEEIQLANGIIIIHPNWWGQPPAILKGWVDRVLRECTAYTFPEGDSGGGLPIGLLKAKTALVFNTSNTPKEREDNVFGDPLQRLWKDCIFDFCGVHSFVRRMFGVIADSSKTDRSKWLEEVMQMIDIYFPKSAT